MAKKEQYRLQTLLGLREQTKNDAERYLGECLAALQREKERLAAMEKELEQMIAKRQARMRDYSEKQMRGEMSAQSVISANSYIERLKEQEEAQKDAIEGQKEVVSGREEDVRDAREKLTVATQDLKALEKHKEKWEKKIKREKQMKEEEALDELAQTIFLNKDRD